MPNWCMIHMDSVPNRVAKAIMNKEHEVDFNKIIPMPTSIRMTSSGSEADRAVKYYIAVKENDTKTVDEINNRIKQNCKDMWDEQREQQMFYAFGYMLCSNLTNYGFQDWYDWSIANWGTKWNACENGNHKNDDGTWDINFWTAWSAPRPIFDKIAEMFPKTTIEMHIEWEEGYVADWEISDGFVFEGEQTMRKFDEEEDEDE